jgi:hypothetical protein
MALAQVRAAVLEPFGTLDHIDSSLHLLLLFPVLPREAVQSVVLHARERLYLQMFAQEK